MATLTLKRMSADKFTELTTKQKDRQNSLNLLNDGQSTVATEGTGANKKVVLYEGSYLTKTKETRVYPVIEVNGQAVALSALCGKSPIIDNEGNLINREGIVPVGATYQDILDALKDNDYKFTLSHINGRVNGFYGRYPIVTK